MKAKKIIALMLLAAFATNSAAECIMRSGTTTAVTGKIDDIVELEPMIVPAKDELVCSVRARVLYQGQWYTIMDTASGARNKDPREICVDAVEKGVRRFLSSREPLTLSDERYMACDETPPDKPRKPIVKGDRIRISDYQISKVWPNPQIYKGSNCRWLNETTYEGGRVNQYNVFACQLEGPDSVYWTVVDKY